MDQPTPKISKKEAAEILWRRHVLNWKLDRNQKQLYEAFFDSKSKITVFLASRRIGKSFLLCVMASELCLKNPDTVVKYVAPQTKMVRTIIRPLLRDIFRDCPPELRPEYKTQEQIYRFPNGSEIQLAGTDNQNAENIRGGGAHLCIVDEAGFCDDLEYIIKSILLPTTTTTRGKVILSSTPPKDPGHPFKNYVDSAEKAKTLIKKTIYDNPRLTVQDIDEMKREYGGEDSTDWRREFLCEMVIDESSAVVPEFNEALKLRIVQNWERPPFYDTYTSMDIGTKDFTVCLFAYYDFRNAKIIVEDEVVMNGPKMTTDKLVEEIRAKEKRLWVEQKPVFLRIADNNNLLLLNDMQIKHGITFVPTAKDNADAALNNMRIMLKQEKIIINPRCETLIRHLSKATWNPARSKYNRTTEDGHYDAVDALKYLCRNVLTYKNPYPLNHGMPKGEGVYYRDKPVDDKYKKLRDFFKPKKSITS